MTIREWAVKHGATVTTFASYRAAFEYWRATLGAVLMTRRHGRWETI